MRTNNLISFLIALLLHIIFFGGYLVLNRVPERLLPTHFYSESIDVNHFSYKQKGIQSQSVHKKKQPSKSLGLTSTDTLENSSENHAFPSQADSEINNGIKNKKELTIIHIVNPVYPIIARKKGQEGEVNAKIFYDEKGIVTKVEIIKSSGYKMIDESVIVATKEWRLQSSTPGSFEKIFQFKLKD